VDYAGVSYLTVSQQQQINFSFLHILPHFCSSSSTSHSSTPSSSSFIKNKKNQARVKLDPS